MPETVTRRQPLDVLRGAISSFLFPPPKVTSESFTAWAGPKWGSFREGKSWLESRRSLEGAEGLWRIDNAIYDLNDFAKFHPGGQQWIELSKGTDITELFKSHHISDAPQQLLPKFYVRDAKIRRNSPFTFHPDGFYEVLKKRVQDKVKCMQRGPSFKAKAVADFLVLLTFFSSWATVQTDNYYTAILAGLCLSLTIICAHNFFHQRDNWRMYYFHFCGLSVKDWRLSHAMSHHMFPNSQHDLEVAMFEPWLQWLTIPKNHFWRFASWIYSPIVYILILPISIVMRWTITGHDGAPELLLFSLPAVMSLGGISGQAGLSVIYWWSVIMLTGSFFFGLIGLNAGHHHPEIFHDGDQVRPQEKGIDWGLYQLLTVNDRVEIRDNILGLTFFGDHCLHHLFPTLDHAALPLLYPDLKRTCNEFDLELKGCSMWDAVKGQFLQLSRVQKLFFVINRNKSVAKKG